MLLKSSPEPWELDRADVASLLERRLVALDPLPGGGIRPRITPDGAFVLAAVMRCGER
jgi:hypothetical protein